MHRIRLLLPLLALTASVHAAVVANAENEVYQYFVAGPEQKNSGAYLWIPPQTAVIRAVMVGIHNGLPMQILQNAEIRKVCARNGVAQILMTPNGSDIGKMLKDLSFDVTDPARTAIYDRYVQALADQSGHPELTLAPIVPLAHSAYCSFPFEAAMRDHTRCLMALPIKAGVPYPYAFFAAPEKGGKSFKPAPDLTLEGVPVLFVTSLNQATVPGAWRTQAIPYGSGSSGHPQTYRDDTEKTPDGKTYKPGNELFGLCWEMMSCHFDMLPRNYAFVAAYLDAVCQARLPAKPPAPGTKPVLRNLTLADGWLIDRFYSNAGKTDKKYYDPAPYLSYQGPRNQALWYPTEALARTAQQHMVSECAKQFEMFTVKDRDGKPFSLAETPQVQIKDWTEWLTGDGRFTLAIQPFTEPFGTCVSTAKDHDKNPNAEHPLENRQFPGKTSLPVSKLPIQVDVNGSPIELVPGPEFTFRLRPHRLAPDPGGYNHFYMHFFKEGDDQFAASNRNVKMDGWVNGRKVPGIKDQTITFPAVADLPRTTKRVKLAATASSGQPVGYFVRVGPAIIDGDELVITQVPVADRHPISITIGAFQVGLWQENGFRAATTVYQTCTLKP